MHLEAGYTPQDYKDRAGSLEKAAAELNNEISRVSPGAEIYLFGSLGRRLALWKMLRPEAGSLGEYLDGAKKDLRPRRNERDCWDIDMGIPEKQISWKQIAGISKEITFSSKNVEVDPHLLVMTGESEFKVSNYGAMAKGDLLRFESTTVRVEGSDLPWRPLDIDTMLMYYFEYGKMRIKDIKDIAFAINFMTREINTGQEIVSERVRVQALKYLNSTRPLKDIALMCYHILTPDFIKREVRKARFGSKLGMFDFNLVDPNFA